MAVHMHQRLRDRFNSSNPIEDEKAIVRQIEAGAKLLTTQADGRRHYLVSINGESAIAVMGVDGMLVTVLWDNYTHGELRQRRIRRWKRRKGQKIKIKRQKRQGNHES